MACLTGRAHTEPVSPGPDFVESARQSAELTSGPAPNSSSLLTVV